MDTSAFFIHLWYYMQQVWHFLAYKLGFAAIFAAMFDQHQMLLVLFVLYVADFACGFAVALRLEAVSPTAMRRGVAKGLLYLVFVTTVAVAEQAISDTSVATATAIGLLIFTEALSIIENLVNLGLPLPFAQRVMRALASKAKLLGIDLNLDHTTNSTGYINDLMSMIRVHIPRLVNPQLRAVMRVYYLNWLDLLRTIDAAVVDTKSELAWERLKASMDETLANAYESALQEGVDKRLAHAYFHEWNADNVRALYSRSRRHVHNCDHAAEIIDNVAMNIVTMLYQILNRSAIWDRTLQQGNSLPHGPAIQDLPGVESGAHPVVIRRSTTAHRYANDPETQPTAASALAPLEPDSGEYQALDINALEPLDGSSSDAEVKRWTDTDRQRLTKRMDSGDDNKPLIDT